MSRKTVMEIDSNRSKLGCEMGAPRVTAVRRTWRACLVVAAVWCVTSPAGAQTRPDVVVSAAVSLGDVLGRIAPIVERRAGVHLVINLAASNVLARQINAGARVDLFISADDAQMDAVARQLLPGTRVMLVRNQLAVAVPRASTRSIRQVSDLLDTGVRRIALGDPESVPAGVYARLYLERVGLWSALRPRLVPSASVRAALGTGRTLERPSSAPGAERQRPRGPRQC